MKLMLIVLGTFMATTSAKTYQLREPEGCQFCREGVEALYTYANSEKGLEKAMEILNAEVCPGAPDPAGCEAGVATWWPTISALLWVVEDAPYFCQYLNDDCEASMFNVKVWDCDVCATDIALVADTWMSDIGIADNVSFLAEEGFCQATENGFDEETQEVCREIINKFMPPALKAIFTNLRANAYLACSELFQIC